MERAVLGKILAGDHPVLAELRAQAARASAVSREFTGVGFYLRFDVPSDVPTLTAPRDFAFGDVYAEIKGMKHGAGFVLFVRDGRLDQLEGFSFDEPWPEEILGFGLAYRQEPRELEFDDSVS